MVEMIPYDPVTTLLRIYPTEMYTTFSSLDMFKAVLFIIVKNWKQTKCPSTEQINCSNLNKGILLSMEINEIYLHCTIHKNFINIMLIKRGQAKESS